MNKAPFKLQRFRFDSIEAAATELSQDKKHEMEMKFEIGFHASAPDDCDFVVTVELLFKRMNDSDEKILLAKARGAFKYYPEFEPRPIDDPFERNFAVTAVYGCMRPVLNTVVHSIGLGGFNLPLSLPRDIIEEPDETPETNE